MRKTRGAELSAPPQIIDQARKHKRLAENDGFLALCVSRLCRLSKRFASFVNFADIQWRSLALRLFDFLDQFWIPLLLYDFKYGRGNHAGDHADDPYVFPRNEQTE